MRIYISELHYNKTNHIINLKKKYYSYKGIEMEFGYHIARITLNGALLKLKTIPEIVARNSFIENESRCGYLYIDEPKIKEYIYKNINLVRRDLLFRRYIDIDIEEILDYLNENY